MNKVLPVAERGHATAPPMRFLRQRLSHQIRGPEPIRNQGPEAVEASPLPPAPRKRLVVIDDQALIRRGLRSLVNGEPDLEVCAEAATRQDGLAATLSGLPDMVTIDLSLRDWEGLELIKDLKACLPTLPVLVISMHDEAIYAERSFRAGARGYVSKQQKDETLLAAIRCVLSGEQYLSPAMAARFARQFLGVPSQAKESPINGLTDRELAVFRLLGTGRGTRQIAEHLKLSVKTIESYREHLKAKLSLQSGSELLRAATLWTETGSLS